MNNSFVNFLPLPEPSTPPLGVDIWLLDLTHCKEITPQIYSQKLSTDDLSRAQKINVNRHQFLLTRLFLREVLSRYTEIAVPDISIARTPKGKPFLAGVSAPLHFNLSHSSNIAVLAVSTLGNVGIDLELVKERDVLRIAQRFFHQDEVRLLLSSTATERTRLFFRLWTLKEAFLKATGAGISAGLDKVSFSFEGCSIVPTFDSTLNELAQDWQLEQHFMSENIVMALAVQSNKPLTSRWFYANDLSALV